MYTLFVFHDDTYEKAHLKKDDELTIGTAVDDDITLTAANIISQLTVTVDKNGNAFCQVGKETVQLEEQMQHSVNTGTLFIKLFLTRKLPETTYYIGNRKEIRFAANGDEGKSASEYWLLEKQDELSAGFMLDLYDKPSVKKGEANLYLNGHLLAADSELELGDILFWNGMEITYLEEDLLAVTSAKEFGTELEAIKPHQSEMKKRYPLYRRTPRMVYELPKEKVQLTFPGQEAQHTKRPLWLIILPPLMMLIVMGIVALFIPRGIFIVVSLVMFATTLFTSTFQYFKDKANRKEWELRRRRIYSNYLEEKREELHLLSEKQREVLHYHFPSFERMKYMVSEVSDRIWERTLTSQDFLQFRIGTGKVPASYKIDVSSQDMSNREMDELMEASKRLEKTYQELEPLPITVDLSKGAIGLIGKEAVLKRELHQLIGQLAFFHSYHDVRFIFIFDEKEYSTWEWMKWLPHFQLPNSHAKGMIYNESTRDQLLSSIYEMIRERDLEEDKEKLLFSPHYIFIIANQQLISEHVILEYLEGEHKQLGISVIFASEAKESFSDNIHTLVRYINTSQGDILMQDKKAVEIPFSLDTHQYENNEYFARMLRTLNHQVGVTNSIPESVSFLEMLQFKDVKDIPIEEYWHNNQSAKSLAVPIGLKGKTDLVRLNLHEKAHGPHGLLAGTTGSGKSEFLQTYILSLAVHFHPHEVAFLLIDYKGGGMAQPFKNMPHLLGTITNIDGSKNFSQRALASIKSELKRRQRLFDQYEVNHINDYTRLHKQNKIAEPLPHLFLISDEFAELKSEQPEFIQELVSAARIGRSLGVHLILATQKPGGIIDAQIWSNARFRIALKVQNAEDSREILKNGDAAGITVTGRGYLQVGNNEVYELFQSAWSGAAYNDEASLNEDEVALVTDLGLVPLSELSSQDTTGKDSVTEMEAIVEEIEAVHQKLGLIKIASPWLPPLSPRIYRPDIAQEKEAKKVLLAMVDEPEKQSQSSYTYEWMEDGNVGVFGSSGYGKTQTMITLLMGIAADASPEEAHFYLLDFGNGGLLPLRQLPHSADYFLMDEQRKTNKFVAIIKSEMAKRKRLFQQMEVSSIKMYNTLSADPLPLWFIVIDNYDVVKDEMHDFETQMNQFARDGQSLGIYMIFSATRVNSIRQTLMNNLRTKIVHYLMDNTEAYSILGRVPFEPEPIPGRAIIKKDSAFFSQVVLPNIGMDEYEQLRLLKEDIDALKQKYMECDKPKAVPMLPSELNNKQFYLYVKEQQQGLIPIGLEEELVEPVSINFAKTNHCLILGQAQKGKTNAMQLILNEALNQTTEKPAIFDSIDRSLSHVGDKDEVSFIDNKEMIAAWIDNVENILKQRESDYAEAVQSGRMPEKHPHIYMFIDGYGRFLQQVDNRIQENIVRLMKNYSHLGFHIVVSGTNNELTKGYDPLTLELKQVRQALVLMKKSEQTLFTLAYDRQEQEVQPGFGYYVENGKEKRIQIPLMLVERKVSL
ncbi:type VII secretion protein EssC [Niallia sp. FSL R7-0271]|uniref:type VII secretion protein EssC n=1 Tax=Niallia sp. FSL R7-0271 TaxID=2921678 RepID=UPI0030F60958